MKSIVRILCMGFCCVLYAMEQPATLPSDVDLELSEWEEVSPEFARVDLVVTGEKLDSFMKNVADATKNRELVDHKKLIAQGGELLAKIFAGKASQEKAPLFTEGISDQQRKDYLTSIQAIMWTLYSYAIEKNEGFTNGILVVQDPSHALFDYLLDYVQNVNPGEQSLVPQVATNCYAYQYPKTDGEGDDVFGIDMRWEQNEKEQPSLPNAKSHISFRQRNDGFLELHMSDAGLCYWDGATTYYSGVAKKGLTQWIGQYLGVAENPLERSYDLPLRFINAMGRLKRGDLSTFITSDVDTVKTISDFYAVHKAGNAYFLKDYDAVLKELDAFYDNLAVRKGREVILTLSDLITLPYYQLMAQGDKADADTLKTIGALLVSAREVVRTYKQDIQNYYKTKKPYGSPGPQRVVPGWVGGKLATLLQQWPSAEQQEALLAKLSPLYKDYIVLAKKKIEYLAAMTEAPKKASDLQSFLESFSDKAKK